MVAAAPRDENLSDLFASATSTTGPPSGLRDLIGAVLATRPRWMADGLCAERPTVNFFPGRGEDVRPAKEVCSQCLVATECRTWALQQGEDLSGVWAGTTRTTRRRMRAAHPELRENRPRRPATVRARTPRQQSERQRPTDVMEALSLYLAGHPGDHTEAEVTGAVAKSARAVRGLAALVDEGFAALTVGGVDAAGRSNPRLRLYRHVRPFTAGGPAAVATDPPGRSTAA